VTSWSATPWSAAQWSRAGWRAHLGLSAADAGRLDTLVEQLGAATIPDLAAESARRFPGRVAFTVDGEPVTHAELESGASQVAAWLATRTEPGDRRWGEQVTAWVVLRPGRAFSEADLISHARTRLAAYKCPKQVFQLTALPRNQLGKLDRRALTSSHPATG
jgi:acyl-CoA synthetase (AMP-forming)/AMP-acid ligase II